MNQKENIEVPEALKKWFVLHFIIDIIFAVPLFFATIPFLKLLGWTTIDPVTARIVAAALFGIGIDSLLCKNATLDSFKTMLNLKVIWSLFSMAALALGIIQGSFGFLWVGWSLFLIFFIFS